MPTPPITLEIRYLGDSIQLTWAGGLPPFQAQTSANLDPESWLDLESPTTNRTMTILPSSSRAFFRVRGSQ